MSVLVLDGVVWMWGVSALCECMLLYLAKKVRSIVGHKECVEGSIVRQEPCELGGWRGVINGKHYLTNWSCFQEGSFLTSLRSEKRRIINRNFPMLSIWLFPHLRSKRAHTFSCSLIFEYWPTNLHLECTTTTVFEFILLSGLIIFSDWTMISCPGRWLDFRCLAPRGIHYS